MTQDASAEELDYLWERRARITHDATLSSLYHRRRERFFALLDRWDKVATLTLGASAFVALLGDNTVVWLGIPFGFLAACSLIFDFAERARQHGQLAAEFKGLEADIESKGERDFDESDLNAWGARLRRLEIDEPATYVIVARMCENEMARARGDKQDVTHIGRWQRWTAHIWVHGSADIQPEQRARSAS